MFMLLKDKVKFFRVKRGQQARDIERELNIPVKFCVFSGMIIEIDNNLYIRYVAEVGDTYESIAEKFCVKKSILEQVNCNTPVYPTEIIFIPN